MPRPPGTPHRDHARKRTRLLDALGARLLAPGPSPSLRDLAAAAGVTIPTLRHYFGTREAVVRAVFADWRARGAADLATVATPDGDLAPSLRRALAHTVRGLESSPLNRMLAVGLAEGLVEPAAAHAFLTELLEPALVALEHRLAAHRARGEIHGIDPRTGALLLLAPLILAGQHQLSLGGRQLRPLSLGRLVRPLADGFARAYGTPR